MNSMSDNSSYLMPSAVYKANLSSASNEMFSDHPSRHMSQIWRTEHPAQQHWRFLSCKIISKTEKVQQTQRVKGFFAPCNFGRQDSLAISVKRLPCFIAACTNISGDENHTDGCTGDERSEIIWLKEGTSKLRWIRRTL